jgi:hypothetical protein
MPGEPRVGKKISSKEIRKKEKDGSVTCRNPSPDSNLWSQAKKKDKLGRTLSTCLSLLSPCKNVNIGIYICINISCVCVCREWRAT